MSNNSRTKELLKTELERKDRMQHFRHQVYFWVKQIPYGKVSSYGRIAKLAGFPRHARHVSKALGQAHSDLELPWFRVIGSDGRIAFDPDNPYYSKQLQLLQKEGIRFDKSRVAPEYFWAPHPESGSDISAEEFFK